VHRFRVTVLSVLNQKHHQECDDGRGGVDDQLPGIRKVKGWSGNQPNEYDEQGAHKGPGAAQNDRRSAGEKIECIGYDTIEVAPLFAAFQSFSLVVIHNSTLISDEVQKLRAWKMSMLLSARVRGD
jgi:hypothetical protein